MEVQLPALALKPGPATPGPVSVPLYYTYRLQTLLLHLRKDPSEAKHVPQISW